MDALHHDSEGIQSVPYQLWEELIVARGYRGIVFDCDGTLVESAEAHFNAFRDATSAQGQALDEDWYLQRTGLDRRSLLSEFALSVGSEFDVPRAVEHSISAFKDHVHLVRPVGHTSEFLLRISNELSVAVGTNAEAEVARASLTATGLIEFIQVVVSISDGLPPKPSPDIFATAAKKLDCDPQSTLVIEDSEQGVAAARAAGMNVLLVSA